MAGFDEGFPNAHNFKNSEEFSVHFQEPAENAYENYLAIQQSKIAARNQHVLDTKGPEYSRNGAGSNRYFYTTLHLAGAFCENVLAHPFVVLRRQCQVNPSGLRRHIVPITLIPIIIRIQSRQGLGTLWKGIGSIFIVKGLAMVFEDVLFKLTQWPNICAALVTPFYSASLIETVQSDIASEKPGLFDCVVEGVVRTVPRKTPSSSRMLPVWSLAIPTGLFHLLHYTVAAVVQRGVSMVWRYKKYPKESHAAIGETDSEYVELASYFVGNMISDIALYPFETVLNRLHVQGTRTIIDNLDTGYEVTPIITKYEGVLDCFQTVNVDEHVPGFYKGIGAIIIQYAVCFAVIKLTKFIYKELKSSTSSELIHKIKKSD